MCTYINQSLTCMYLSLGWSVQYSPESRFCGCSTHIWKVNGLPSSRSDIPAETKQGVSKAERIARSEALDKGTEETSVSHEAWAGEGTAGHGRQIMPGESYGSGRLGKCFKHGHCRSLKMIVGEAEGRQARWEVAAVIRCRSWWLGQVNDRFKRHLLFSLFPAGRLCLSTTTC
jgi:hypothetical protein